MTISASLCQRDYATHTVENVASPLQDYNLFSQDQVLMAAVHREGAAHAVAELESFGQHIGRAEYLALGDVANHVRPELATHDRYGRRQDLVSFHPAYHQLMQTAMTHGLHSLPWEAGKVAGHVHRAALCYMHSQVEAGHGCPVTMTFAGVAALRATPELSRLWLPKVISRTYDARNIAHDAKNGLTLGMAMTEKQGGSDVRSNSTRAYPLGHPGPGMPYELVGHKFFVSAPMSDAFLMLAQAPGGLTCFLVPRWRGREDKNAVELVRLKDKMGNASNASSEVELRGALGWMVGEEGRGVATIIEMVAMTRFDCMVGSAAGMRMAVSQALHHCRQRSAFGALLSEQPLMQNVLADLALENEAALHLSMRMARALDHGEQESEGLLARLGVAIGKYWICKRTPQHAYEAMECIGGSGVMENCMMPRLYREAPINAIWEGSGNVQCLDVLRALHKTPAVLEAFWQEIALAQGQHALFDSFVNQLQRGFRSAAAEDLEFDARRWVDQMALALQASLMLRDSPAEVADAFCVTRLQQGPQHQYGTLPRGTAAKTLLLRATVEARSS